MAWEFKYELTLHLTHFLIDPKEISTRIKHLRPSTELAMGDTRVLPSGVARTASNSVWTARLHEGEFLHSGESDFGNTIRECLERLRPYAEVFQQVRQQGYAYLRVVWFADSSHSVGIIPADVLMLAGSIELDLDLEFYTPDVSTDG
jgi:hypothetical protein